MGDLRNSGKPSRATQTLTRDDALAYLRRFPAPGRLTLTFNLALILASNATVFWLLVNGRLRGAHLIALLMIETTLLIAITWLEQRLVPRKDWSEQPKPWRQKLPVIAFVLVWLGGAYGMTLAIIDGYGDFLSLFRSLQAWRDAGLQWPLLATLALAMVHAGGDLRYYHERGGPFLSTVGLDAIARYLTLILGGIPFAMPFFVAVIGGFKGIEYVVRKARIAPQQSLLAGAAMLAMMYGSFALVTLLIDNGVAGWAIGFVLAKLIAELLLACIPVVMSSVAGADHQTKRES